MSKTSAENRIVKKTEHRPPLIGIGIRVNGIGTKVIGIGTGVIGIGTGQAVISKCELLAKRKTVAQQWRKCRHLIVDEVRKKDGWM